MKKQKNNSEENYRHLDKDLVHLISKEKNEPKWMLEKRLKALEIFLKTPCPKWGPDLSFIDYDNYILFIRNVENTVHQWEKVPSEIKDVFQKLHVIDAEKKHLCGVNNQFNSQVFYNKIHEDLQKQGVIFCSIEQAMFICPELVNKYFGKIVPPTDNKFAALNTTVWSGGSFIYVPKNVKVEKPLQAYFRINTKSIGQFERTLIIVDEGAYLNYIEGCTASVHNKDNLHAAVVEVFVEKNAHCSYTTIQNWSDNVLNLVTKRCLVEENGTMEWVDGNIGSRLNMKYPCTILKGEYARAKCISIASAHHGVVHDTGAKMIHLGKHTRSSILAKSIAHDGGRADYRGLVQINSGADNSYAEVCCDTLILDEKSVSNTMPTEIIENKTSFIKHEAKITRLDREKMFYLQTKGFDDSQAKNIVSSGFLAPFTNKLPMEYAVELNRLLKEDFGQLKTEK